MEYEEDYLLNDEPEEETDEERAERERIEREQAEREQAKHDAEALSALAEQANAEMRAQEDATAAQSQPPPVPPIVEPTPQMPVQQPYSAPISNPMGRMYMGPNISDAELEQLVPRGTAYSAFAPDVRPINEPLPGSLEEALAAAKQRDVPGRSQTLAIQQPIQEPPQITVEPMKSDAVRQSQYLDVMSRLNEARNHMPLQRLKDLFLPQLIIATAGMSPSSVTAIIKHAFPDEPKPTPAKVEKPPDLNKYESIILQSRQKQEESLRNALNSPFLKQDARQRMEKELLELQKRIDAMRPQPLSGSTNAPATNKFKIRMK